MNKYKNKIDQFTISFVCILFYSFGAFKESESNLVIFLDLLQLVIQLNIQNRNSSDLWLSEYYLNLRSNKNFIRCLVGQDRLALNEVSERLRADKDIVMAAVTNNGWALRYASEALRADKDIVMAAVTNNGLALEFASLGMEPYVEEIMKLAVAQNGLALKYVSRWLKDNIAEVQFSWVLALASDRLRDYKEIVRLAVAQNSLALEFAHFKLKHEKIIRTGVNMHKQASEYVDPIDQEIVMAAIKKNGLALEFASEALKNDKEIVKLVVAQNGLALEFVGYDLRADEEIARLAVAQNGLALKFASDELRANEEIVLEALQQNLKAIRYSKLGDETNKRLLNKVPLKSKFVKPEVFGFDHFLQEDNNRPNKGLLLTNEHVVDYLGYRDLPGLFVNRHARDLYLPTAQKITSELSND